MKKTQTTQAGALPFDDVEVARNALRGAGYDAKNSAGLGSQETGSREIGSHGIGSREMS